MSLNELADRCEKATGPDRELDRAIFDAVTGGVFGPDNAKFWHSTSYTSRAANKFTASLDAAMTLVPEGYDPLIDYTGTDIHGGKKVVELYFRPEVREIIRGCAETGPLALCAASLRARALKEGEVMGFRIGGFTFFGRYSNGDLGLVSFHPRSSGTWHWSLCITRTQPHFPGLVSRLPRQFRRGQWHTYLRLPFRYALLLSRQDYHKDPRHGAPNA